MSTAHDQDNEKYLHHVEVRSAGSDHEKGYPGNVKLHDEVFGDINEDGPNYRGVSRRQRAAGLGGPPPQGTARSHPPVRSTQPLTAAH